MGRAMRFPKSPPDPEKIFNALVEQDEPPQGKLSRIFKQRAVDTDGRYLSWEKMRFLTPPEGLNNEEWWTGTKFARSSTAKPTPFLTKDGVEFNYCTTEAIEKDLHWIDLHTAGTFESHESPRDDGRDTYIIKSLVEEAISSSQLEGASTTRHVAKEMIRKRRKPVTKSEQMILNNYLAMQFIREMRSENITTKILLGLHARLTEETLSSEKVGRFRDTTDDVYVEDLQGNILHIPPDAQDLEQRVQTIVNYANDENESGFTHPVIRAIILHFMLGYDHPFVDGNGRTARALFYWSMAKSKYWLIEYISLSKAIKASPVQYGKAYLLTETDDGDLTYFVLNQLKMIRRAIENFQSNLKKKMEETRAARDFLEANDRFLQRLNFRQLSLLKHAIRHPGHRYNIEEHKNSHGVTYETARRDLLSMSEINLLDKSISGRRHLFIAPTNMHEILQLSENKMKQQDISLQRFFNFNDRESI